MEKFGPDNPLCGPMEFRNTLEDMLAIGNIKNVDRYYKQITEEVMQQIAATPKEPDPNMVIAQAEMEKTRAKMAESIAKSNYQDRKLLVDDDFKRDELTVKSILDARKIEAQFMTDVNEQFLETQAHAIDSQSVANEAVSVANDAEANQIQRESNDAAATE
jgi:hypothetical protein